MARTAIAVQEVPFQGSAAVNFGAADSVNGMVFPNDGRTILLVKNAGAAPITVTVASVQDEYGRSGDISAASVDVGAERVVGPLRPALWNQKSGTDMGKVYVDVSDDTSVTVAALRLEG